jgi:lipid A 3-O-deacylase
MLIVRIALLTAVAVVLLVQPDVVLADAFLDEFKIGVLWHDVPGLWSGFQAEPNSADINIEALLSPSVAFLGGTIRPAIGGSISTVGATSDAYIDARWQYETPSGIFFGLGLGAAVHDGQLKLEDWDRKALGSRVLFHIPLELGLRLDDRNSVSVYFEHTSNANLATPNEGLDAIGLRYGRRF